MKVCTKCGGYKPYESFYLEKKSKDGYRSRCKACMNQYSIERRKTNPPILDPQKRYERNKRWLAKNPGWKKEYDRNRSPEKKREINNRRNIWLRETGKGVLYAEKRRATKMGLKDHFTEKEWIDLQAKFHNKCLDCGKEGKLTPDHILPLSKGGADTIDNIQPLCRSCNCRKGVKFLDFRK